MHLLKVQQSLFDVQSANKKLVAGKEKMVKEAKSLRVRATHHTAKMERENEEMAKVWEVQLKEEEQKTGPLQEVIKNDANDYCKGVFLFEGRDGAGPQAEDGDA